MSGVDRTAKTERVAGVSERFELETKVLTASRRTRRPLRLVVALVTASLVATAVSSLASHPAGGNHPYPYIDPYGVAPNVGTPAGETRVRIHGDGFTDSSGNPAVASVKFGGAEATHVKVVDDNLLTLKTPPGPANTEVAVSVTNTAGQTYTTRLQSPGAFFYGDPTFTVTDSDDPGTDFYHQEPVNVSLTGYPPNTDFVIAEASPLATYLEPRTWDGPNPAIYLFGFYTTDAKGNFSGRIDYGPVKGTLYSPDRAAVCPPTQVQANAGLTQCSLVAVIFGRRILAQPITFDSGNPTPYPATLQLSSSTAGPGDTLDLGGQNWSGSPVFGSSTSNGNTAESNLAIEICGLAGDPSACSATTGQGSVAPSRHPLDLEQSRAAGEPKWALSGGTLQGRITVGPDVTLRACMIRNQQTCFVRVRQQALPWPASEPDGSYVSATAPLEVTLARRPDGAGRPRSTTTTTLPTG